MKTPSVPINGGAMKRIILIIAIVLISAPANSSRDDCEFSHLAYESPLLSTRTTEITETAKEYRSFWKRVKKSTPHAKQAFVAEDPYYFVLLGWQTYKGDFSYFTRDKAIGFLSQYPEKGKSKALKEGTDFKYHFSSTDPLTLYVSTDYSDSGDPYRDLYVDIVATPKCMVSLKVIANLNEVSEEEVEYIEAQFEILREIILDEYGPVEFSGSAGTLWLSLLIDNLKVIGAALAVILILIVVFKKLFQKRKVLPKDHSYKSKKVQHIGIKEKSENISAAPIEEASANENICPKCSSPMVKRTAKNERYAGKQFWVCKSYPKCKHIKPVE